MPEDLSEKYWRSLLSEGEVPELGDFAPVRPAWHRRAGCRGQDPATFVPPNERQAGPVGRARAVCATCPVTRECLFAALDLERQEIVTWGVWGGTTRRERLDLLRREKRAS